MFSEDGSGQAELSEGLHEGQLLLGKTGDVAIVNGTAIPPGVIRNDQNLVVPVITALFPDTAGMGGGTSVTINGVGFFTSAVQVLFGDTPATSIVRRSSIHKVKGLFLCKPDLDH